MPELYYRVGPAIWREQWSDDARYVAFYLLTCRHRNTEGLYYLPLPYAGADLGWPAKRVRAAFGELERSGFVSYDHDAQVCLVTKALKWQGARNTNQITHAVKALREVPPTPLQNHFRLLAETYSPSLAEALPEGFGEGFPEPLPLPHCSTSSSTTNASSTAEPERASANVEAIKDRLVA